MNKRRRPVFGLLHLAVFCSVSLGGHSFARDEVKPNNCSPEGFKVVVDVGHTAEASGSISARGVSEYEFNLGLARTIVERLRAAGFIQTSMIVMHGVGRKQLLARSNIANAINPDLFLSIHHDDVQSIYYKTWVYHGIRRRYSDNFHGYSVFVSNQNAFHDLSLVFAKLLGRQLIARGMRFTAHHAEMIPGEGRHLLDAGLGVYRYDELSVLKNTHAPAALFEAGLIVNRNEETALRSAQEQETISSAIVAATTAFCDTKEKAP